MLTLECGVTLPGVCEDGRYEVKQGKGLRQVGQTLGVLFHRLEVTLTVLNDVGDVLRFLAVQVIQEFHLTGVQGLYQLNSHSKLCHLV